MNAVSGFFSCLYNNQTSCLPEEMPNQRVATAALMTLGFLGMSYLCEYANNSLSGRAVAGHPKGLFETLEKNYLQLHSSRTAFGVEQFEKNAPFMESLLAKWTLSSEMRFFHFLGLNIFQECKSANISEEDLNQFFAHYQELCNGVAISIEGTIEDEFYDDRLKEFISFAKLIPEKVSPSYNFLLKILMFPEAARAMGKMRLRHFEKNEILDGEFTRKEDVKIFLDFASRLYPNKLRFIGNCPKETALSEKLNTVLHNMQKKPKFIENSLKVHLYDFITSVKWTVDYRLLEKKIPTERFLANILMFHKFQDSENAHWFTQMSKEYLNKAEGALEAVVFTLNYNKDNDREHFVRKNYALILILVNKISTRSVNNLERIMIDKLERKRKSRGCTPKAYAIFFAEVVRFYQIIHDVRFLKDARKDHLEGRHIPDSFADLAFLSEIEPIKEAEQLVQLQVQEKLIEIPSTSSPDLSEEESLEKDGAAMSCEPKIKVKTRPVKVQTEEEHAGEEEEVQPTIVDMSNNVVMEKYHFPRRNVSGETVMRLLLNNGFIIENITGSHYQMHHVVSHVKITVPFHRSLKPGTLHSIRDSYYRSQGYDEL